MKYCNECGKIARIGSVYCGRCGSQVLLVMSREVPAVSMLSQLVLALALGSAFRPYLDENGSLFRPAAIVWLALAPMLALLIVVLLPHGLKGASPTRLKAEERSVRLFSLLGALGAVPLLLY